MAKACSSVYRLFGGGGTVKRWGRVGRRQATEGIPSRGQCDTGPSFFCCVAVNGGFCSSRVSASVGYLSAGQCLHCGRELAEEARETSQ